MCGDASACDEPKSAYDLALANLRTKYLFVGLLEHYELTVAVLARLLPEYFEGGDGRGGAAGEMARRMHAASRVGVKTNAGGFTYAPLSQKTAQALLTAKQNRHEMALYHEVALLFWDTAERTGLGDWQPSEVSQRATSR